MSRYGGSLLHPGLEGVFAREQAHGARSHRTTTLV